MLMIGVGEVEDGASVAKVDMIDDPHFFKDVEGSVDRAPVDGREAALYVGGEPLGSQVAARSQHRLDDRLTRGGRASTPIFDVLKNSVESLAHRQMVPAPASARKMAITARKSRPEVLWRPGAGHRHRRWHGPPRLEWLRRSPPREYWTGRCRRSQRREVRSEQPRI